MRHSFKRWMQGRYGTDQLSYALLILALLTMILTAPFHSRILKLLPLIPFIFCYYRIFSRNFHKRQQENFYFIRWWTPYQDRLTHLNERFKLWRTYKYFKCPKCGQKLRVPRKRGKICITCPKCKHEMHKRS